MRALLWGFRIFIFMFLLVFALKNTDVVRVTFFFDYVWQESLIVVVLAFFVGGVLIGVLSLLGTVFGLHREVSKLKREAKLLVKSNGNVQPIADSIGNSKEQKISNYL